MHRFKILFPALLLLTIVAAGCSDKTVQVYTANLPVYSDVATWRAGTFAMDAPRALRNPGKIYRYNDLLIVNEFMKGVHIFNNANPSAPVDLGFLPVHANVDIAVRDNIMYLDSYTDLLAFNIQDPSHPTFMTRANDVFDFSNYYAIPGFDVNMPQVSVDPTQGVVIGWIQGETSEEVYNALSWRNETMVNTLSSGSGGIASTNIQNTGQAGSTARFAIHDHHLYTLESRELGVFDVAEGISHVSDITLDRMSETLFPQDGYLYIGTTTGMSIYSLANPSNPTFVSMFNHVTSCDPVVVQGDKAFVTLRSGNFCNGNTNELMVVDLADISNPVLLYQYPMTNPHGLGVDANTLFLCDGADGLKIFDKTDLGQINNNLISQFTGITAADVIPHNQVLMMTSAEGIYQYSYADLNNIVQLSLIPVVR